MCEGGIRKMVGMDSLAGEDQDPQFEMVKTNRLLLTEQGVAFGKTEGVWAG